MMELVFTMSHRIHQTLQLHEDGFEIPLQKRNLVDESAEPTRGENLNLGDFTGIIKLHILG